MMDSGFVFFATGILFFLANAHWNSKLYAKKVKLEEREREFNRQMADINAALRLFKLHLEKRKGRGRGEE